MRKSNEIIVLCKVAIILTKNGPVFIDTEDIPRIQNFHWNIDKCSGYCITHIKKRKEYLHRIIAQTPPGLQTDHIDGCKANNRFINLRIANASLNQLNRQKANRNSRSQELGVRWRERHQKWEASLVFQKKYYYFGLHKTKEEAVKARTEKLQVLLAINQLQFIPQPALDTVQIISIKRIIDLPDESLPEFPLPTLDLPSIPINA
jgi:hypothetical protein